MCAKPDVRQELFMSTLSDDAFAAVNALAEAAHAAYELLATVQPTHRTTHDLKQALARIGDNA